MRMGSEPSLAPSAARTLGSTSRLADLRTRPSASPDREARHVTLIDLDRLVELWVQYSRKLGDADRQRLALKPSYFQLCYPRLGRNGRDVTRGERWRPQPEGWDAGPSSDGNLRRPRSRRSCGVTTVRGLSCSRERPGSGKPRPGRPGSRLPGRRGCAFSPPGRAMPRRSSRSARSSTSWTESTPTL
jgi:hypothetical protein